MSHTNISAGSQKDTSRELSKGLEKALEILLKPEQSQEQMPYELSQKAERLKKKKQAHRL